MIKIAVFGNRNITDEAVVTQQLVKFLVEQDIPNNVVILHGGAAGPAKVIAEIADNDPNWTSILFKPWTMIWSKLNFEPIYFYLRNKQIVENADIVLIITNGEKDSEVYRVVELCQRWEKPHKVYTV